MNYNKEKDKKLEKHLGLEAFHFDSLLIMKKIDNIAKKHKIIYSTYGGTLLGHIRHLGFIPWDDDADIIMTRDNFDRFVAAWETENKKSNLRLLTPYSFNGRFLDMIYRICDLSKEYKQCQTFKNYDLLRHPRVDIFILDNIPDNKFIFKIHSFRLKILYSFAASKIDYINPIKRPIIEKIGFNFFKLIGHLIPLKLSLSRFEKVAKKYDNKKRDYCHSSTAMLFIDKIYKKGWFADSCYKDFENVKLQCTKDFNSVLSLMYGKDYMIPKINHQEFQKHFEFNETNTEDLLSFYSNNI